MAPAPSSWGPTPAVAGSLAFIHFNRTPLPRTMKGKRSMIQSASFLAQVRSLRAERPQGNYLRVAQNCNAPTQSHFLRCIIALIKSSRL